MIGRDCCSLKSLASDSESLLPTWKAKTLAARLLWLNEDVRRYGGAKKATGLARLLQEVLRQEFIQEMFLKISGWRVMRILSFTFALTVLLLVPAREVGARAADGEWVCALGYICRRS